MCNNTISVRVLVSFDIHIQYMKSSWLFITNDGFYQYSSWVSRCSSSWTRLSFCFCVPWQRFTQEVRSPAGRGVCRHGWHEEGRRTRVSSLLEGSSWPVITCTVRLSAAGDRMRRMFSLSIPPSFRPQSIPHTSTTRSREEPRLQSPAAHARLQNRRETISTVSQQVHRPNKQTVYKLNQHHICSKTLWNTIYQSQQGSLKLLSVGVSLACNFKIRT